MPVVTALATALPRYEVRQDEARRFAQSLFRDRFAADGARLARVFEHAGVRTRRVAAPLSWQRSAPSFAERNARYVDAGLDLATKAARRCLARAGVAAAEVDHVLFVSSTGLATPSLDARLANRLGFSPGVRRTPVWGLGCAGGAVGLARAAELATADSRARVLLVALELCSLTLVREDLSLRNLVASALFGDGCAAALVVGERRARPARRGQLRVVRAASRLWPDTLDVMGWELVDGGLQVVMSRDIPEIARTRVRPFLEELLADAGLALHDVRHFALHPGGPRVLDAFVESLGLPRAALAPARRVMSRIGNVSSATCLFVLERIAARRPPGGQPVLVAALGPGFSAEAVVLETVRARQ